ncbi:MAG TPA: hypothetical protein VG938_18645 [Verrucomicrobiae bacterium]|jgi:hypothetical protein|nr:hypothetical protein [Verrucomicrobiae bacterium]
MKFVVYLSALLVATALAGCSWGRHKTSPPPMVDLSHSGNKSGSTNALAEKFLVTPDEGLRGRVASVNANLRFVVLTFPVGQLPSVDSRMNVFRNGAIVGEVKITGPQRDDNSVADIMLGDAQKGDEVRQK